MQSPTQDHQKVVRRKRVCLGYAERDWTGHRFGDWTVLGAAGRKGWNWMLKCQCKCGTVRDIRGNRLCSGKSKGCEGCLGRRRMEDKVGRRYGRWLVLRIDGPRHYICRCNCGDERRVIGGNLYRGQSLGCAKCRYAAMDNGYIAAWWCSVRRGAESRGHEVAITKDEALELLAKQGNRCALSGVPIRMVKSRKNYSKRPATASLDRIDSTKGYIPGNIQWVHKDLNYMKQRFSQEYFIWFCRKVAKHSKVVEVSGRPLFEECQSMRTESRNDVFRRYHAGKSA
jgi:hypothetical protein